MRILVLGGTQFLGRHVVEAALARGHDVTLFNRGQTRPELFPGVERLVGDRDGDLAALEAGSWDAVVDTSGYVPRLVRASAELLEPRAGRYLFVSSISVYADVSRPGVDEDAPVAQLEEETEEHRGPAYGALKALCEHAVQEVYGERATIVRPGLIVGPWDPTGRFTYWPARIAEGGDVLAPEPRDAAGAGDRRPRPRRGSASACVEDGRRRRLQRDRARRAADARAGARGVPPRRGERRRARLGAGGLAARAGRRSRGWSCRSGSPATRVRGLPADRRLARARGGPALPPARGDDRRHARLDRAGDAPADPPAGLERDRERELLAPRR